MKIGFNLLLYTGHVTEANYSVIEKLKATGYDGVEVPIFDVSNPAHFKGIGQKTLLLAWAPLKKA